MRALPLLLLAAALAGCLTPALPQDPAPPEPALRLLVLGDAGTGTREQQQVAAAALRICLQRGCDAALMLGDNIYETGVGSVDDPQFDTKFEQPYAAFDIPFYLVLGNHDNGGEGMGLEPARGDFQVQYTTRADRASDKWNMPARWYDVRLGDVHLVGIDATTLYFEGHPLGARDLGGAAQRAWAQGVLEGSDAAWKVVFSHHPYVSNGQHGDAGQEDYFGFPVPQGLSLRTFYEEAACPHADLLLGGHDHDLQWLKAPQGCRAEQLVSGAAAKQRPLADEQRHEAWFQAGDTLGFAWLEFRGRALTGAFYDGDGALLFERAASK